MNKLTLFKTFFWSSIGVGAASLVAAPILIINSLDSKGESTIASASPVSYNSVDSTTINVSGASPILSQTTEQEIEQAANDALDILNTSAFNLAMITSGALGKYKAAQNAANEFNVELSKQMADSLGKEYNSALNYHQDAISNGQLAIDKANKSTNSSFKESVINRVNMIFEGVKSNYNLIQQRLKEALDVAMAASHQTHIAWQFANDAEKQEKIAQQKLAEVESDVAKAHQALIHHDHHTASQWLEAARKAVDEACAAAVATQLCLKNAECYGYESDVNGAIRNIWILISSASEAAKKATNIYNSAR